MMNGAVCSMQRHAGHRRMNTRNCWSQPLPAIAAPFGRCIIESDQYFLAFACA